MNLIHPLRPPPGAAEARRTLVIALPEDQPVDQPPLHHRARWRRRRRRRAGAGSHPAGRAVSDPRTTVALRRSRSSRHRAPGPSINVSPVLSRCSGSQLAPAAVLPRRAGLRRSDPPALQAIGKSKLALELISRGNASSRTTSSSCSQISPEHQSKEAGSRSAARFPRRACGHDIDLCSNNKCCSCTVSEEPRQQAMSDLNHC